MASATTDAGARTATTGSVSSASAVPTAVGARRRLPTASTVAIEREGMRTKILRSGEKSPRLYRAREDAIPMRRAFSAPADADDAVGDKNPPVA